MNVDLGTLVLIAIIVVAVVLLIKRLMPQQSPYSQPGPNRPQYDDPNISSHGGFGGNQQQGTEHRQYDDPNIESHGGFGPSGGSNLRPSSETRSNYENVSSQRTAEKVPESTRRNDDPNVSSHGGFGGKQ